MSDLFRSPSDRTGRAVRWFRRGSAGLVGGRSEAAREVDLLGRARPGGGTGAAGVAGAPGPDGTARLSRGVRLFARPFQAFSTVNLVARPRSMSGATKGTQESSPIVVPPVDDLSALPVWNIRNTSAAANQSAYLVHQFGSFENPWRFGRGDGTGGFLTVVQFAIKTLSATPTWFVGLSNTLNTGPLPEPYSGLAFGETQTQFGVGQAVGDATPQWMYSGPGPSFALVKSPVGISSIVGNQVCELRLFSDPEGSGNVLMSLEVLAAGATASFHTFDTVVSPSWDAREDWSFFFWVGNGPGGGTSRVSFLGFFHEYQPIL